MIAGRIDAARTRELRRSVLRPLLGVDDPLPGDDRPDAVHFAAWDDDGNVLSACLIAPQPCPWRPDVTSSWVLRQMATRTDARGRGAGTAVLEAVIADLRSGLLWCRARQDAVGFYRRHGFEPEGVVFLDTELGIPHQRMSRQLD